MLVTSAEAAKLLRKVNEEKNFIENNENQICYFMAAINEDIELARPEYDYSKTRSELNALETKIRKLKHAINKFNLEHEVPGFNMTVDQMLIYIPQLTQQRQRLSLMKNRLPKHREYVKVAGIIEYTYANYDVNKAKEDYDKISDELAKAQTALDVLNNQVKFEIDI